MSEDNNFTKLIRILVKPFQDVESMWQQLLWKRNVNDATGVTLTKLGDLVGQPRNGITDDEVYRRYVRARIVANKSNGRTKDLITVSRLVVYDDAARFEVLTRKYRTVVVRVKEAAISHEVARILLAFLKDTAAGGVRVILEYSTVDPSQWMVWGKAGQGWTSHKWKNAIA